MSKKRQVKIFDQFVNEKYSDFNNIFNTIKNYIDFTLKSEIQINKYVQNTHY